VVTQCIDEQHLRLYTVYSEYTSFSVPRCWWIGDHAKCCEIRENL